MPTKPSCPACSQPLSKANAHDIIEYLDTLEKSTGEPTGLYQCKACLRYTYQCTLCPARINQSTVEGIATSAARHRTNNHNL